MPEGKSRLELSVPEKGRLEKEESMKKKPIKIANEMEDDLLAEYDLDSLPIVERGPGHYAKSKIIQLHRVTLEPDVAKIFPDDASVNQALRLLIQAREIGTKAA